MTLKVGVVGATGYAGAVIRRSNKSHTHAHVDAIVADGVDGLGY